MQSPSNPVDESTSTELLEVEGGEETPGSNSSQEPLLSPEQFDANPAQEPENVLRIARPAKNLDQRIADSTAAIVDRHLEGVEIGANLPEDMSRDRKLKLLKAEALWRAGIVGVTDIGKTVDVGPSTIYEWALTYHWPKRADLARLSTESVRAANILAIAMKAKEAKRRIREAREFAETSNESSNEALPDGVSDLNAERDARPMTADDAQRAVIVEQASSAALQDAVTSMYVESVSKILNDQQQLANSLVDHVRELAATLKDTWDAWKLEKGKGVKYTAVREEVARQIVVMRQLVAMASQSVALQRRVWMLDSADGGAGGQSSQDDGGVPAPVQRGTYEDIVRAAEAGGIPLTR